MPLLEWLDRCALPEEARLADPSYAAAGRRGVRRRPACRRGPPRRWCSARTSPPPSTRSSAGPSGRPAGHQRAGRQRPQPARRPADHAGARVRRVAVALAARWHGRGRLRYAVTPRFSYSAGDGVLAACARCTPRSPGSWFTSHVNENLAEVAEVARLFPDRPTTSTPTTRTVSSGRDRCWRTTSTPPTTSCACSGRAGASIAQLSDQQRGARAAGCSRCFGTTRTASASHSARTSGAGTGFSLFKEGLQAYFHQRLLGPDGVRSPPPTCCTWRRRPGPRPSASPTRWATCRWEAVRRGVGATAAPTTRSTSACGTPTRPRTRWPRSSPSAATPTSPVCGSAAPG